MGYFVSEGIYDCNLSFWGKKFKNIFFDPTQLLENAPGVNKIGNEWNKIGNERV